MAGLGRIDLVGPEDLETGAKRLSVFDDALRAVQDRGLHFQAAPASFRGELPSDITALDDNDLGDLLSKVADYCGYVDGELAKADIKRNEAQAYWEFIQARVRLGLKAVKAFENDPSQKLTVKDKDDMVCTDPRVVDAKSRLLYAEAYYALTRTVFKRTERNWDTVSRRITQRGQDVERMKRETNVTNIPAAGHRFGRR